MTNNIVIDELGEIERSRDKKLLIRLMEYQGWRYLDIRLYLQNGNGKWLPSQKGITLNKNSFENFFNILLKSNEMITEALDAKTAEEFEKELAKAKKSVRQTKTRKMKRERMEADSKQLEFGF